MKFSQVHAHRLSLRVKAKNGDALLHAFLPPAKDNQTAATDEGIPLRAVKPTRIRGEFDLLAKDGFATVVPVHPVDVNPLTDLLASGRSLLARLTDFAENGDESAELEILDFFGKPLEMGTVEIGIDEKVQKSLQRDDLDEAARRLYGKCVLRHGDETFFFMLAGAAAASYLEPPPSNRTDEEEDSPTDDLPEENPTDEEEDGDSEYIPAEQPEAEAATRRKFAIVGADYRFALEEKDKGNGQILFLASHVTSLRNQREDPALRLARGNLKFVDWTAAGERSMLAKIQLDRITESADSYLRKWDKFGEMEGSIFLERARKVGAIPFDVIDESRDGILTLRCAPLSQEQKEALGRLSEVGLVRHDECPEFLADPAMTFQEFSDGVVRNDREDDALGIRSRAKPATANRETGLVLEVEDFNPADGTLLLKEENAIPRELDTIVFPIAGEIAQIKRRKEARDAIRTGRAANPDLGLLIEENGNIPARQAPPKQKALTAFVRQKVFPKNPPTIKQEEAIRVALNTPDIALIQGPPGTGKTTVIAAIVERLHEESDKRGGESGRVLLTGFQHDAVENLIERLTINGLPVPKFGHRPGEDRNASARLERQLREWCDDRIAAMEKRNPQIARIEEEEALRASCIQYIKAPTLDLAISLMEQSLHLPDFTLGNDLRRRLQRELAELERLKAERDGDLPEHPALAAVRSLRTRAAGFADDGPARAADVLAALDGELAPSDKELLEKAKRYPAGAVPPFLDELRGLKGRLLTSCTPAPVYQKEKRRISVCDLVEETMACIRKNGLSIRDKKTAALAELLMELQSNPDGMLDAVKDYSFAFAATCQQSVNRLMQNMKGIQEGSFGKKLEYDYVIVDEAARVGPRDLMIPMAQGKRIILVGDHRQLPHLIDDEIADRMERDDDGGKSENDWIKESMFEYLFTERLPALEKADGILRRVTLDKQFRMHPLLGDFVSRNFYERFDPGERFSSGLPESAFVHDLPKTGGRCAVWLDVPFGRGDMRKAGTSWTRPAEVEAICRQLKEWMVHDNRRTDGKRLTFGVIAFYKAQADAISRSLGTSFKDEIDTGRLRIGTVDSFQGREFDVVILSPVRTGRRGFGFLQIYNRLNVAMSRQKKLLAVAGDSAFYETVAAGEKVPGLANFLQLCRDKGVVL